MKRTLCICMAWLGLSLAVQAQTCRLTTPATSIAQGRGAMLDVTLANEVEISGGQFTVTLPQGITIKDVTLNAERSTNHTLEYRLEGGNSAKILFYAQPTAPLKGNGGTLCTLALEAASDVAGGEYKVAFSEVRLAVDATTAAEVNTVEGTLKVISCYTIMVEATEGGSAAGGGVFVEGDMVTLAATPDEGYHFVRWSDGNTTNPYTFVAEADVDLTAEFAPNVYRIVYMLDGEVYKTESYAYGSAVTAIAAPVKEGYTFGGWSGVPATMPAKDVTVSGSFAVNTYTLTYMLDGEVYKTESYAYGSAVTAIAAPVKEGYTFGGWSGVPATMPAKDVTVSGSFAVNTYTLTYMLDGEVYKTESYAYGSTVTAIAAPVKEGYTFGGWSGVPATMPAKDVTVSGSFAVNTYTLTYMLDGEVYKTESYAYGSAVTATAAPIKEGYTFGGWSGVPATMPAKDVTVSGSFAVNTYTLTYMLDGEVYKTESYAYGSTVTAIAAPVKEGYTFGGWSGVPATMPAKDVTVVGSFVTNGYTLTYVVDGEVYKTLVYEYGSIIIAEPIPTKEGYTFSGWSDLPATMPANDMTVSGSFTINKYLVTFKIGDVVVASESLEYGTAIVAPEAPEKEGHTFNGWGKVAETVPAHDVTYEGSYSVNSYTLTYMVDGEKYWEGTVAYGTALTALEAPTKRGYTFSGWSGLPATMPANDVTVDGSFTIERYTVTFYDWDGTVLKVETVAWGQAATPPADPTREGYTFIGWDFDYTNVVWDLAVHAEYVKNAETVYTVEYHAGANGWIEGADWYNQTEKIVVYTSPLYRAQGDKVTKLRITVNRTKGDTKYFCLSELELYDANGNRIALSASNVTSNADHNALNPSAPDGGGFAALFDGQTSTYFHSAWKNMPTEDHYLEITLPSGGYDAFSFKMLSRARTIENGYVYDQSHTFPGVMVMSTSVELVAGETPEPEPEPKPELDNDAVYYVSQPYNGGTSWTIATGGSAMTINTKLGITADGSDARQQFAFITNDGGKTHYLYHPAEKKYVNKDNTLSATPRDPVYFLVGEYENTFVVYFDESHIINTNNDDGLIINRWGPLSGWGKADGGNSCLITRVEKSEPEPEPEPNPQPELDNETLYFVSQPYRGATSWAIAKGGTALQCNGELGIAADKNDTRQQFAFISNDGGKTHYLYHPAERKYVNMDGSLSATPRDPVYFMPGAYENTFIVYFDIYHFINVNENPMVVINQWGPADNGWRGTADGGNSCLFTAVGRFDVTDIDFLHGEDFRDVRKVFENGEVFILLPDGSKYTMTGVKVK